MRPGPRNLITDVTGLTVGHAVEGRLRSGCTVLLGERPFTAAVNVMGGAPGTRETDLLAPDRLVQEVDALVLSGGSAFGLDACSGVADGLRAMGRGFAVGDQRVPIVPGAILFDLLKAQETAGITLTESQAMLPTSAVSGFYFAHPDSQYFGVARIGRDQLEDYAARRGVDLAVAERWLRPNLD